MADRYWKIGHEMGYAGTTSEETIDVLDIYGWDEETLADYTNDEIEQMLNKDEWQTAIEKIGTWAEPISKEDME